MTTPNDIRKVTTFVGRKASEIKIKNDALFCEVEGMEGFDDLKDDSHCYMQSIRNLETKLDELGKAIECAEEERRQAELKRQKENQENLEPENDVVLACKKNT